MTWFGLWKPPFGRIIPAEWYWFLVDSLDVLYSYVNDVKSEVEYLKDCIEKKLDLVNYYLHNIDETTKEIKLELEKVEEKLDLSLYYQKEISDTAKEIKVELQGIESKLDLQNEYLRLIAPAKGVLTITKTVTPTPTPLYVDELTVRRIVVKVPVDALYLIYIGDASTQEFVLEKGEKLELYVKNPKNVYVKSTGEQKIFLLFELAQ